ncbi:MAG TPA: hypothetical protein VL326_05725 [Kofleriaceae bacterium]|nr:hypothetical protein [Kofleriaceae bacterium]
MTYRNDIDALSARHATLAAEVEAKTKELDSTSRMLDEMKAKAKLPVLPNIRVASPCTADWKAMAPVDADSERVRHCGDCNKNVYNLSQMTRDEAEALILAKEGRLCVRYFQRKDGTILLKDCTVGVTNGRKRKLIAAGAAALLAGGVGAAFALRPRSEDLSARIEHEPGSEEWQDRHAISNAEDPPPPAPPVVDEEEHNWHELKGKVSFDHEEVKGGLEMPTDELMEIK